MHQVLLKTVIFIVLSITFGCKSKDNRISSIMLFSIYKDPVYVSEIYWFKPVEIIIPSFRTGDYITNDKSRAVKYSQYSSGIKLSRINALLICKNWTPLLAFGDGTEGSVQIVSKLYCPEFWEEQQVPSFGWVMNRGDYALERFYFLEGGCSPDLLSFLGFNYEINGEELDISIRNYVVDYAENNKEQIVDFFMYNQIHKSMTILDHEILQEN